MLIVASIWYLVLTSILMIGQFYLERHFARGVGDRPQVMRPSVETGNIRTTKSPRALRHTATDPPHTSTAQNGTPR